MFSSLPEDIVYKISCILGETNRFPNNIKNKKKIFPINIFLFTIENTRKIVIEYIENILKQINSTCKSLKESFDFFNKIIFVNPENDTLNYIL